MASEAVKPGAPTRSMTPFFILWAGQAVSLFGSQLVQFALIWWLTQETGSATVLATASLVGLLPQVVLGPLIGALVDRWWRKLILFAADAFVAVAALVAAYLFWSGDIQVWHVFALLFVRALGSGFHQPTMLATTSLMVPEKHLTRIQGLNQSLQAGLNIISAPLGALLLSVLSMVGILGIDVATAVFAILPLAFIHIPQPKGKRSRQPDAADPHPSSVWRDISAGFRYVWGRVGLRGLMLMAAVINLLLVPTGALLPILVSDHFDGGALQFAWMQTAMSAGMLSGGILLGVWGGFQRRIATSLCGILGIGIGVSTVGLSPAGFFYLALAGMFVVGLMVPITNGPLQAIVQAGVAPEFQGRVFTLLGTLSTLMSPLGLILAGPLADVLGVRFWYVLGGIACLAVGTIAFAMPAIMHIEEEGHVVKDPSAMIL